MNYIKHQIKVQPIFTDDFNNFLHLPSTLTGFTNTKTNINTSRSNRCVFCLEGQLNISDFDRICECDCKMHKNGTGYPVALRHLPICNKLMHITFFRNQLICSIPKGKHSIGINEFKLHNGYKYATHIIDMETGHILWIAHGKKKQVYSHVKTIYTST